MQVPLSKGQYRRVADDGDVHVPDDGEHDGDGDAVAAGAVSGDALRQRSTGAECGELPDDGDGECLCCSARRQRRNCRMEVPLTPIPWRGGGVRGSTRRSRVEACLQMGSTGAPLFDRAATTRRLAVCHTTSFSPSLHQRHVGVTGAR